MKALIFTDNHFCSSSSIVRQRGEKYSKRLENQIETMNWIENFSVENDCDCVICLGDFFDKPTLNDEELTAIKEIQWNNLHHYFVVGNHESSVNGLMFNSTKSLESKRTTIVDSPMVIKVDDVNLCFLPYIIESDRKELKDYFGDVDGKKIILSHNDVKGIQMGPVISKTGFDINDIQQNCDLFLNGHIHNGMKFADKCYNLGNVTGLNFSEDASKYSHNVVILDTTDMSLRFYENPYALNFYKVDINTKEDFNKLLKIKSNAIVSITCLDKLLDDCKEYVNQYFPTIIYRIVVSKGQEMVNSEYDIKDLSVDHLSKFVEFCKERINNDETLSKELEEICK